MKIYQVEAYENYEGSYIEGTFLDYGNALALQYKLDHSITGARSIRGLGYIIGTYLNKLAESKGILLRWGVCMEDVKGRIAAHRGVDLNCYYDGSHIKAHEVLDAPEE